MHFVRLQNVSSQLHFLLRNVEDLLVDRVLRNELVHGDFALLPNPVAAILCLTVHRRIEVAVVDDDRVGADQIQSQSSDRVVSIKTLRLIVCVMYTSPWRRC